MTFHSLSIQKSSVHNDQKEHTKCSEEKLKSVSHALDDRQSPWPSMWISIAMQFNVGVQISIYYMSMWPYLNGLDKSATLDFLGWVVASCSFGCSLASFTHS
uniref:MFS domain-containing protein n=1 Tax=Heterorhabditis bacteriophora TaxID=37862 RepID=A0A1I7X897_HETBA